MQKPGFVWILPLLVVTTFAFVSAVTSVKVRQFELSLKQNEQKNSQQLQNLNQSKIKIGQLRQQLHEAKQKGVNTATFEVNLDDLRQFIKDNDFPKLSTVITSYSATINEMVVKKEAEDLKRVNDFKNETLKKVANYKNQGVDVGDLEKQIIDDASSLIDKKEFASASAKLGEINKKLDALLAKKQEADRVAAEEAARKAALAASSSVNSASSYARKTINTTRGSFTIDLVTVNLAAGIRVITDTANENDCFDNCPTKSLASYVGDNSGFAGINGTYFCPADYNSCAGKTASYDLPVLNTRLGRIINDRALFWNGRGMFAFGSNNQITFFAEAKNFGGNFRAAIANFPSLIAGGKNILNEGVLDDKQRTAKIYRGGIANKGNTLYLMVARGATVGDLAAIMESMSVDNGLNLDGGGSSALYYGGYKVGPGRSLPNAVIIAQ